MDEMSANRIFDCRISDRALDEIASVFVPARDALYFNGEEIANACLEQGIPVYTRQEFASMYPLFALEYGAVYRLWTMQQSNEMRVLLVHPSELNSLSTQIRRNLLVQQVRFGRGHIYNAEWMTGFDAHLSTTIDVDGALHSFLTWENWWGLSSLTRKQWVLRWLQDWVAEDARGVEVGTIPRENTRVPYEIIDEHAGTFGSKSTGNCFAAAIAMVVGAQNPHRARVLVNEWLHQGPFFRLLDGQAYVKHATYLIVRDVVLQPADVLVWYTGEGVAGHAGFAVTDKLIFEKHGQGWDNPWLVLNLADVWYNEYLKTGGYIEVYRRETV
ncbi:hypothetical protein JZ785_01715 [Alicyclobacillus curvatus]|nr:hypothetical protein JZ785_01715 [Alicyclobacillus curvatus]